MIRSPISLIVAALLASVAVAGQAVTAQAQQAATAVAVTELATAPAATARKKDQRICKSVAPTGTRLAKRTCLTAAQWEEAQRIAKEAAEKAQTSALMINKEGN